MEISEEGSTLYLGDYDYYVEKKAELEFLAQEAAGEIEQDEVSPSERSTDYQQQKATQKEVRKISRRIEAIEAQLETIEKQEVNITKQMAESNDAMALADLQKELDAIQENQMQLMEEWEEQSQLLEELS